MDNISFSKKHPFKVTKILKDSGESKNTLKWSPNGEVLAARDSTFNSNVYLWDWENGKLLHTLKVENASLSSKSFDWAPDGSYLVLGKDNGELQVWSSKTGKQITSLHKQRRWIDGIAHAPHNSLLASSAPGEYNIIFSPTKDRINRIVIWDIKNRSVVKVLNPSDSSQYEEVQWSSKGNILATPAGDHIHLWNTKTWNLLKTIKGLRNPIAWSKDSNFIAAVNNNNNIVVWNVLEDQRVKLLQGLNGSVATLRFSPDQKFLAASGTHYEADLWIWRCDTWEPVLNLGGLGSAFDFHPSKPILAASTSTPDRDIYLFKLDYEALTNTKTASTNRYYMNAKVVLVGDTGVGKSGIAQVLSTKKWLPTESTHSKQVYELSSDSVLDSNGIHITKELFLWDLAGQPSSRLLNQLQFDKGSVFLVVFDSRDDSDPFKGVIYWANAIQKVDQSLSSYKILVAARSDRGGVGVGSRRIKDILANLGFNSYVETSAKDGVGINELHQEISANIDWQAVRVVHLNEMLTKLKKFISQKRSERVLIKENDLFEQFINENKNMRTLVNVKENFISCLGALDNMAMIRRLRFGGYVLVTPELLEKYATDIINSARNEPDGLGLIAEDDVLDANINIDELNRIKNHHEERLLLIATVETLLAQELVFIEEYEKTKNLVFPSQVMRTDFEISGKSQLFSFKGDVQKIYSTLAVKLSNDKAFDKQNLWKNCIILTDSAGREYGVKIVEKKPQTGEIAIFYEGTISEKSRNNFEGYVLTIINSFSDPETIRRKTIQKCSNCGYEFPMDVIQLRIKGNFSHIRCSICDTENKLDHGEIHLPYSDNLNNVKGNEISKKEKARAELIIKGKLESEDYDIFFSYNSKDLAPVMEIGQNLKNHGILPWLDKWELRPGTLWQEKLNAQIASIKSAAVFIGPDGLGPWHNLEQMAFIQQFIGRQLPIIPVYLPGLDNNSIKIPALLNLFQAVDFRTDDPNPIEQLIWGITRS